MKLSQLTLALVAALAFSPTLHAQDDDAFKDLDIPSEQPDSGANFDNFKPDTKPSKSAKSAPKTDAGGEKILPDDDLPPDDIDTKPVAKAPKAGAAKGAPKDEFDDTDLDQAFADEGDLAGDEAPKGDQAEAPPSDGSADLLGADEPTTEPGLDDALTDAQDQQGVKPEETAPPAETAEAPPLDLGPDEDKGVPSALMESSNEPIDPNDPSYQLSRVPLLPPMSDENWRKWAGPALDKVQHIRKGDTLWAVSEKLFGTPYLWPKVWQLNANLGNPHQIEPKIDLAFRPGNPNDAPVLAMSTNDSAFSDIPLIVTDQKLGTLETLETFLNFLLHSPDPPFRKFVTENVPEPVGQIPEKSTEDRMFYVAGDHFPIEDVPDGDYNIIRVIEPENRKARKQTYGANRLNVVGRVLVENKKAYIESSYEAIQADDMIVKQEFEIPAFALHDVAVGGDPEDKMEYIPIDDGAYLGVSQYRSFGLRLPEGSDTPPGSLLTIEENGFRVGTAMVVERQGRYATVWLTESIKEISGDQHLR